MRKHAVVSYVVKSAVRAGSAAGNDGHQAGERIPGARGGGIKIIDTGLAELGKVRPVALTAIDKSCEVRAYARSGRGKSEQRILVAIRLCAQSSKSLGSSMNAKVPRIIGRFDRILRCEQKRRRKMR